MFQSCKVYLKDKIVTIVMLNALTKIRNARRASNHTTLMNNCPNKRHIF